MRVAAALTLRNGDREKLARIASSRVAEAGLARRARIVLLAAEGLPHTEVARRAGVSVPVVREWRSRYAAGGIKALEDQPRAGRPRTVDETAIVVATLERPPERLAVTHWSSRLLARELGVSSASIIETWRKWDLQPWRRESFKFSADPQLEAKLTDVVGLYLNPPEKAIVLCVDEKSQIQALDRTQPSLPMKPGRAGTMTHDYKRHGTTTLFAALSMLDGSVVGQCLPRHRHQEFLKFLRTLDREFPPELDLHLILDNYRTHKHPNVEAWLAKHPRFHLHFTPTSSSWLNLIERWFRELTNKRIRRGVFHSVPDLIAAIEEYLAAHNQDPKPFVWTAEIDTIMEKVSRARAALQTTQ